ncbi:MAG TPA: CvpA family protein [Ktedonobacterales bacterium]|nr:CvpA family protein [Ktedonobacterales bacterium]
MSILTDHWLDLVAAIVLLISIWHGWRTGLLVGLFNLLSIPLGIAAAYFLAPRIAAATNISLTSMYAIVFFVTVIGVHIVGSALHKGMRKRVKFAADTDALLGALVGAAKAWILLVLFLVVWGGTLNSSTVRSVACSLTPVNASVASNLGDWQKEYNQTVGNSIFAHVNSFIVPQQVDAQGCSG